MRTTIKIIVKDLTATRDINISETESFTIDETEEKFLLDGPVAAKVAVLDFDEKTGALIPGAKFIRPTGKLKTGRYEIKDPLDFHSRDFQQVSVFGTVLKTIYLFEQSDVLGRPITWAFKSPQLLIVPRAGEWENAFYERESHSLQFFYFTSANDADNIVYTCLSHDIVSHETAHAILDGIAPDLHHAITPQSLAMHEAVADLTAGIMAFGCADLAEKVLEENNGSIENSSVFSGIGEQFQEERDPNGRKLFLRNLSNNKTLCPDDRSTDNNGDPNFVRRNEPHELSEVLGGALYSVLIKMYNAEKQTRTESYEKNLQAGTPGRFEKSLKQVNYMSLKFATGRFARIILRALDYLPPGEISFADYGRAIVASDQVSFPDDKEEREWIKEEFVKRCIISKAEELDTRTNFDFEPLQNIDLESFVQEDSDWAAYQFAEQNREFLGIPKDVRFRVRPRLDTTKKYFVSDDRKFVDVRECIFKVSWDVQEDNNVTSFRIPRKRQITVGTTLAIDWEKRRVRALLTSGMLTSGEYADQSKDRDMMLEKLLEDGTLGIGEEALGADGKPLRAMIKAETLNNIMRIRSTAKMLHITPQGGRN